MRNNRLYELAQIRENEYMLAEMVRQGDRRGSRRIASVTRLLRRRNPSTEG
jgi:hypothetical protein